MLTPLFDYFSNNLYSKGRPFWFWWKVDLLIWRRFNVNWSPKLYLLHTLSRFKGKEKLPLGFGRSESGCRLQPYIFLGFTEFVVAILYDFLHGLISNEHIHALTSRIDSLMFRQNNKYLYYSNVPTKTCWTTFHIEYTRYTVQKFVLLDNSSKFVIFTTNFVHLSPIRQVRRRVINLKSHTFPRILNRFAW